jgi:hypothetical protein
MSASQYLQHPHLYSGHYLLSLLAGLILRQGYIPENYCANQTQNYHLKLYFPGVAGLKTSSCILYDYATGGYTAVYMYCIYSIHTLLCNICIYS